MAYRWEARSTTPGDYRWTAAAVAELGGSVVTGIAIGGIDPPYCKTAGGESRAIRVNNGGATAGTVTVGGTSCTVVTWTANRIVVTMPAKAAGSYPLVVTAADASIDTLESGVTYYNPGGEPTFVVEADASPEDNAYD